LAADSACVEALTGVGLYLNQSRNVILRNLKITDVLSAQGDAITIENSSSIWVDHCELSSTGHHGQNSSNGLLSIIRGSDFLTVTATLFENHPQAVRVGNSDTNSVENKDKLHVTFARNSFHNVDSAISFRFGTGHIFNTYFKDVADGINAMMGAQLLIESSVFEGHGRAVFSEGSTEAGYATVQDVVLDRSSSTAPSGNMTVDSLPYPYNWYIWETETVQESVTRQAGNTLEFTRAA
jgi:pectate lyase